MSANSVRYWQRTLWLFLLSRRSMLSVLAIVASSVVIWLLVEREIAGNEQQDLQIIAPLLPALVLGISISGPFGDIEQTSSLPVWRLRLIHTGALLSLAVLALSLLATIEPELDRVLLLRNLAGYTGMAWLGSQILGPAFTPIFVWAFPIVYVMMVMAVDSTRWWAWAKQSTAVDSASFIAVALLTVGLLLVVAKPNQELVNDGGAA